MKTLKCLTLIVLIFGFTACSNTDDNDPQPDIITPEMVSNLHAPQEGGQGDPVSGPFTKFDFASGQTTTSDTDWDIAFRGTSIIVNGGSDAGTADEPERIGNAAAYIATGALADIETVETGLFVQDGAAGYAIPGGSGNGWYSYAGPPTHLIAPIPGRILVFRTRDGRYAKVEILSYYKDAPEDPDALVDEDRYFTFNYIYQSEEGNTAF